MHAQMALRPGVSYLPHSYSGRRSSTSLIHPRSPTPTLASGPLRLKSVLASSKSSDKLQPPGPSKLPHNDSSAEAQQPEGDPDTGLGKLLKLLSKYPITSWLAGLAEKVLKGAVLGNDGRTLRVVRMIVIFSMFCIAALFREASLQNARVRPREVLYSNFVTLVDEGRVRAARLEAGTSKLYFDIHVPEEPAATSTAAAAPSSSAPASASAASGSAAMTSTPAVQAVTAGLTGQASAAAVASASSVPTAVSSGTKSTAPYRMQKQFFIKLADKSDPLLIQRVVAAGVEFAVVKASLLGALYNILITALAVWLPLLPLIFLVRRMLEDRNSSARKKRSNGPESVTITFDDVAGVDSAKEELAEVVSVMKSVKASYKKLKVKMPSGVLLCGPPGTGKTLLAKAVAGEAGIPFMAVSASEFVEMYVGRGAARIRELFAEARKVAPCVVFIDELDAVGARRGMGYNDERDQTLNQLLTELDGFEGRPGVLFLAATNRIDVLDPALLRPGRLSRKVVVPLPDEAGRRDILGVHLRGVPLDEEEDKEDIVERLARVTSGFSGAELANVVNEASLLSARKTQDFVGFRELLEGVQRTRYGVNGQSASKGSLQQTVNNWLMNIATEKRKAKNAVA